MPSLLCTLREVTLVRTLAEIGFSDEIIEQALDMMRKKSWWLGFEKVKLTLKDRGNNKGCKIAEVIVAFERKCTREYAPRKKEKEKEKEKEVKKGCEE